MSSRRPSSRLHSSRGIASVMSSGVPTSMPSAAACLGLVWRRLCYYVKNMAQLPTPVVLAALLSTALAAPPVQVARHAIEKSSKEERKPLSKKARLAFIQRAQVWMPTNVSAMDLRAGPKGKDAFAPNAMIACDYVPDSPEGSSRKFNCAIAREMSSRSGTASLTEKSKAPSWRAACSGRSDWRRSGVPVRVACRGCSSDPWTDHERAAGMRIFDPAAIERKPEGHEMKADEKDSGWAWPELALVDEAQGGASRAQRDALILLAVFIQHTDSKPEQQRLLCLPGG